MIDTPSLTPEDIAKQAEAIASEKIEHLKAGLIQGLGGEKEWLDGNPKNWNHVEQGVEEVAERKAQEMEERVMSKIEAREKAKEEELKQTQETERSRANQEFSQVVNEWREAVSDGLLPAIDPEVQAKLDTGKNYADLTPDEQHDPGLVAYNEAFKLHAQLRREGKSSSFYRTVDKFMHGQPAGANAPVFGGGVSTSRPQEDDYTYEEIHSAARSGNKFMR